MTAAVYEEEDYSEHCVCLFFMFRDDDITMPVLLHIAIHLLLTKFLITSYVFQERNTEHVRRHRHWLQQLQLQALLLSAISLDRRVCLPLQRHQIIGQGKSAPISTS